MEVILKKKNKKPPQNKTKQMLILAPFNLGEKKSMFKINKKLRLIGFQNSTH